jgi:hypothetical protein
MGWAIGQDVLRAVYAVLPVFYTGLLANRWYRHRDRRALRAWGATAVAAGVIGWAESLAFASAVGGRVRGDQLALAGLYFFAVLVVLKGLGGGGRRWGWSGRRPWWGSACRT